MKSRRRSRFARRVGAGALASLGWLASAAARAETPTFDLSWNAPPECPGAESVRSEVRAMLRVLPNRRPPALEVNGAIEKDRALYRLRVDTRRDGRPGTTRVEARSCDSLGRAAALIIALAFGDGVELVSGESGEPAPATSPDARSIDVKIDQAPPRDLPKSEAGADAAARWSGWASAAVAAGIAPETMAGPRIGAALGSGEWSVIAHATLWPSTSASAYGIVASYDALTVAGGACSRTPWSAASICTYFEAGAVRARSAGATRDGQATAPWYSIVPAVVLQLPAYGSLKLRIDGEFAVSLNRPQFVVVGLADIYQVPRFVPMASIGLAYAP